jgi:hypothetical protein
MKPEQSEKQKRRAAEDGLKSSSFLDFRESDAVRLSKGMKKRDRQFL